MNNKNICYEEKKLKECARNHYYLRNGKINIEKQRKAPRTSAK